MALLNWSASNNLIIYRNRCYFDWKQIILYTGKKIKASNTVEIFKMTTSRLKGEKQQNIRIPDLDSTLFNVFQIVFILNVFYISFGSSLGDCGCVCTRARVRTHTHSQIFLLLKSKKRYSGGCFYQIPDWIVILLVLGKEMALPSSVRHFENKIPQEQPLTQRVPRVSVLMFQPSLRVLASRLFFCCLLSWHQIHC